MIRLQHRPQCLAFPLRQALQEEPPAIRNNKLSPAPTRGWADVHVTSAHAADKVRGVNAQLLSEVSEEKGFRVWKVILRGGGNVR
jgi:hypothetical protein